jgi:putative transposase
MGGSCGTPVQYRNKVQAALNSRIDGRMQKGSKRRKRMIRSKKKQPGKIAQHIRDSEHKQTSRLITTLRKTGVPAAGHGRCARYQTRHRCWSHH